MNCCRDTSPTLTTMRHSRHSRPTMHAADAVQILEPLLLRETLHRVHASVRELGHATRLYSPMLDGRESHMLLARHWTATRRELFAVVWVAFFEAYYTFLGEHARIPRHHGVERSEAAVHGGARALIICHVSEVRHARFALPQLEHHTLLLGALYCRLLLEFQVITLFHAAVLAN